MVIVHGSSVSQHAVGHPGAEPNPDERHADQEQRLRARVVESLRAFVQSGAIVAGPKWKGW